MRISHLLWVTTLCAAGAAMAQVDPESIERATLPLPESLRAGAAVIRYDANTGERETLRKGSNSVECTVRNEEMQTVCTPVSIAGYRDLQAKLRARGLEGEELSAALLEAVDDGRVDPIPPGAMFYRLDEREGRMKLLWVTLLPDMMANELAISTAGRFKSALEGMGTPWMMREGTPTAHVMIPVNGTELSNPGGAEEPLDPDTFHPWIRATLPLPPDLRRETRVVTYNRETGEMETLREGSNGIVCATKNPDTGFTRCFPEEALPEMTLRTKLIAEGKSGDEMRAALAAAVEAGDIAPRRMGSMFYRMYEEDDGLKLLWVLRLPGVKADEIGAPTSADRDAIMAGRGTPWLMRDGTDGAHLMIPINGTALSNIDRGGD